jgi:maltose alpha-D-glucosyltransferase/alpha-amylase
MFGRSMLTPISDRPYQLTLGSYAFYWLRLEPVTASRPPTTAEQRLPALAVTGVWQNIFEGEAAESLERVLPGYLQTQSWFSEKGGVPTSVRIVENIPLDHGDAWIMLVQAEYAAGEAKRFVLPLTFRDTTRPAPEGSESMPPEAYQIAALTISSAEAEPRSGILFDAIADRRFAQGLLDTFARHRRFRGASGQLRARTTPACRRLHNLPPFPLEPTLIKTRQDNTSLVFGDRFIFKLFRWVEEGVHPEVELTHALSQQERFTAMPVQAGTLTYYAGDSGMTWGTLSKYVPNEGDAWNYTVDAVRRFFEHVLTRREQRPEAVVPNQPFLDVVREGCSQLAGEWIGSYLESARLMGQRAAEMHLALASIPDDPAFAPEPFTIDYQRSTFQTSRNWVYRVGQLLRRMIPALPASAQADAQVVLGREADIIQYLRAIMSRRIAAQRIRCHGDFRLSSLLFTGKDFVVIDFEGEILRPLSSRRHRRSPLRDVAAWVHSMYSAVQTVLQDEHVRPADRHVIEPWARFWQWWVSVAFVKGYLDTADGAGFLPKNREEMQIVLDYSLLGRGIYDLRFQLLRHPERGQTPLKAILHLLRERDRRQSDRPEDAELTGSDTSTEIPVIAEKVAK